MQASLFKTIIMNFGGKSSRRDWTHDALEREDLIIVNPSNDKTSPTPTPPSFETRYRDLERGGAGDLENDAAWGEMMPPGDGFVRIQTPPTSIPAGIGSKGEIYDISLFHQLHCLSHIRTYLYTMQASLNQSSPVETFKILLAPQEDHVQHCFDYLRQGLMCAGDMTLEWPRTEDDGRRFAVDGWHVEHQCKSWDAIMRYMEENTVARHY
ncbi:hypothetical protein AC578_10670 [Pseudocercospora eumusae]|uniref:Uncharacterized protein n=1 Tax=Pseudocercospora eumusae TaxID=321146 RepID=A0A139HJF6_9PEZI|nr:hypothetical protein AC578_10670 [Pseudocercospora eumusae]